MSQMLVTPIVIQEVVSTNPDVVGLPLTFTVTFTVLVV